jgi:hypothetical protein
VENGGRNAGLVPQPLAAPSLPHRWTRRGATEETARCTIPAPSTSTHNSRSDNLSRTNGVDLPAPTPSPRDDNGRFAAGNAGGPGRPKGRGQELQRAAQEAITPEHVAALMGVALRHGLQGNLGAIRLVLERACGRVPDAVAEAAALDVALPNLRTASACALAIDKITAAITAGTIELPTAKALTDIVLARMKAIELNDLEQRLVELEKQASTVDFGRRT